MLSQFLRKTRGKNVSVCIIDKRDHTKQSTVNYSTEIETHKYMISLLLVIILECIESFLQIL